MKEEILNEEWTDGVGKALKVVGGIVERKERETHQHDDTYVSDPEILIMDLRTGASLLLVTEEHEGGKTHGHGYRKCKSVMQNIPSKLPTKKVIGRLVSMIVKNFVPTNAPPEQYSVLVSKAIADIAAELADESKWNASTDKHAVAVNKAISDLLSHTMSRRAGDSLLKMKVAPNYATANHNIMRTLAGISVER